MPVRDARLAAHLRHTPPGASQRAEPPSRVPPARSFRNYDNAQARSVPSARPCRYLVQVRLATWNVNSVRQRVPRLLPWLDQRRPDVLCLQETKLPDHAFHDLLGEELRTR